MIRKHAAVHGRSVGGFSSTNAKPGLKPLAIATLVLAISGCAHVPPERAHTAQWTYPENAGWGAACEAPPPPQQSPIDFTKVAPTDWKTSVVVPQATFDPHDQNVVFTASPGPSVSIAPGVGETEKGFVYTVTAFHFHYRNEHVTGGNPAFEIHIKTKDQNGAPAVFGALWTTDDRAADDPTLLAAYKSLSTPPSSIEAIDLGAVLWRFGKEPFYSYEGSLTTPPCTAGVRWFVLQTPIRTSPAVLERLRGALKNNGMPDNNVRAPQQIGTKPPTTVYLVTPKAR
jgi:carbonic anhydrase